MAKRSELGFAKEIFLDSGGEAFHYIACLNDNDEHVEAVSNLITNKISQL